MLLSGRFYRPHHPSVGRGGGGARLLSPLAAPPVTAPLVEKLSADPYVYGARACKPRRAQQ